jgi:hypothetical protein
MCPGVSFGAFELLGKNGQLDLNYQRASTALTQSTVRELQATDTSVSYTTIVKILRS